MEYGAASEEFSSESLKNGPPLSDFIYKTRKNSREISHGYGAAGSIKQLALSMSKKAPQPKYF